MIKSIERQATWSGLADISYKSYFVPRISVTMATSKPLTFSLALFIAQGSKAHVDYLTDNDEVTTTPNPPLSECCLWNSPKPTMSSPKLEPQTRKYMP